MAPNASTDSVGTASSPAALPHLQIVDKLTELPLVHSALDYANTRYAALKSSSSLVSNTLDRAEKSFQLALNTGLPVVVPVLNKLEQPIHLADNIAVQGLDLAVAKIDAIQKSSGEFKDSTLKVVDQTKERLSAARASAVQTVHSKVQSVMTLPSNVVPLLDQILSAGENVLDYLLPEAKDGATKSQNGSANGPPKPEDGSDAKAVIRLVIYRMRIFTDKVQKRVVDYSRQKWIPAVFASVVVIQKNVLGLVANGVAAKLIAANGHANASSAAASAVPAEQSNGPNSSTPKKSQANNSSPAKSNSHAAASPASSSSSSTAASNGDVKAQQVQEQQTSNQDLDEDDSLSS